MKKKQDELINIQQSIIDSIQGISTLVDSVNEMPEKVFVGRVSEGAWAGVFYEDYGIGLACFVSITDCLPWLDTLHSQPIEIVQVTALEAASIAKRVNLEYIHLLSNEIRSPLGHFSTSARYA